MTTERVVIIGAGPAGFSTARSFREHGGQTDVVLIGAEAHPPYERPSLTKEFLRGERAKEELLIEDERWFDQHQVTLLRGTQAVSLDRDRMAVELDNGQTLSAGSIVLSTGARPTRPDLPGCSDPRVLTMREIEDSIRIANQLSAGARVLVLGTGFIGCEIAASAAMQGARVTLIGQEQAPQEARLGSDAGARIASWLQELKIELVMGADAAAVRDARTVELKDGRRLDGELVVLGMGVQPNSEIAVDAGLSVKGGAVIVTSQMRAADGVYAVGDVALAHNRAAGRPIRVEHWGDALGHGEVLGRVLAGEDAHWEQVPGFWSTIGDHTLKYSAWGDGYDNARLVDHGDGAFTIWYERDGAVVGVLTHDADQDYERGQELIAHGDRVADG